MFELKPLSRAGIPAALEKVERYRLLNEPWQAESICRDVLALEPAHPQATIALLLTLTDQFGTGATVGQAREVLANLRSEFERAYYAGIICERWALALLAQSAPGCGPVVYDWLRQAMEWFEAAEPLRPPGNDAPILRWNTCARLIMRDEAVEPRARDDFRPLLE